MVEQISMAEQISNLRFDAAQYLHALRFRWKFTPAKLGKLIKGSPVELTPRALLPDSAPLLKKE
jgi:hypothetical protein